MPETIQQAMSQLLSALRFDAMARDVLTEEDTDTLRRYARVIVNNTPPEKRLRVANLFRMHKPRLY